LLEVPADEAGMHLVGWLSEATASRMSDVEASALAAARDVDAQPLSRFASRPDMRNGLILGYAAVPEDEIEAGARRLASALEMG
jgi:GntR family transcriptional regulator/MocR family aminotransferase